jgi:hypothetical protein
MNATDRQLAEDRALRDAALRLFKADLDLVRGDLATRGVGQRAADRVGDAALDTMDEAVDFARDHKGQVAAGLSAIVLFLFRGPLLDALARLFGGDDSEHDDSDRDDEERA